MRSIWIPRRSHLGRVERPASTPPSGAASASRRALHVLLAEDHAVNKRLATAMLEKHGHNVVAVENGQDAISAIAVETFDLVLMDVQMPKVGGLEAISIIRASEIGTGRHLPIVTLTAHAMKGDREACLAAGSDAYLAEPIRAADLLGVLEQLSIQEPSLATRSFARRPRGC